MWRLLEKKIKQAYLVPAWMICVCECVYVWVSVCVSECVCVWGECSPEECLHTEGFTLWQVVRIDPCSRKLAYKVHKCMRAKSIQSCPTLWDPDGCSLPDSRLTLGFSRQEYWSGLPCFSRGSSWPQGLNLHLCLSLFLICCLTRDNHPEWYAFVVVVQSCPTLCDPAWTIARQAPLSSTVSWCCWWSIAKSCLTLCDPMDWSTPGSLSFIISRSLLKFISIESLMPSNHLILCHPLLLLPSIFSSNRVIFSESTLHIRWPKYWSFSFSIIHSVNVQDWFPLGLTGLITLLSKGLSRVFSNITVQKHQFFGAHLSLWSKSHIHTWLLEKP